MRILIRTTTEKFEIDEALTITEWIKEGTPGNVVRKPTGPLAEDQLIEMFEEHHGSAYGDKLFGQIDFDCGSEIIECADEDERETALAEKHDDDEIERARLR